jgi:hypothetical protein
MGETSLAENFRQRVVLLVGGAESCEGNPLETDAEREAGEQAGAVSLRGVAGITVEEVVLPATVTVKVAEADGMTARMATAAVEEDADKPAHRRRSRRSSSVHAAGKRGQAGIATGDKENTAHDDNLGKSAEKKPRVAPICEEGDEEGEGEGACVTATVAAIEAKAAKGVGGVLQPLQLQQDVAGGLAGRTPVARRTRGGRTRI